MTDLLDNTLAHLEKLVSFDTRNPPRAITTGGIFDYLRANLPGFQVEVTDHGAGAVSLYAVRGTPRYLFNVHLDTVPDSPHWSADPHVMRRLDDRVVGLGVCDIKGAAAALVAAANLSDGDAAFLFSSDEEANDPRCIAAFLARGIPYEAVLVAEPTLGEAVLAHRGISSVLMKFSGRAGHASGQQDAAASALHQAMRWGGRALDHVQSLAHARFGGLTGLRFNIGRVEGGIKANMIAPEAELRFGFRPLPSMDIDQLLATFAAFAEPRRPRTSRRPSAVQACRPATSPAPRNAAWPRATSPRSWACRSATRSISGPRPRCSRPPATPRWSTAPATSPRPTPPTSS